MYYRWANYKFRPWVGAGLSGRRRTSAAYWRKPLAWNRKKLGECTECGWRGLLVCKRGELLPLCGNCGSGKLVASLTRVVLPVDVFNDDPQSNGWRIALLELIELTHWLNWLLPARRPEAVTPLIEQAAGRSIKSFFNRNLHVWIGTFVEDQESFDEHIPKLIKIPAGRRFVIAERLSGPIDLGTAHQVMGNPAYTCQRCDGQGEITDPNDPMHPSQTGDDPEETWCLDCTAGMDLPTVVPGIDWVIAGGGDRPAHPQWVRGLRDQCVDAGVPFFFDGWGQWSLIQRDKPVFYGDELVDYTDSRANTDFGVLSPDGEWYHRHTGWNGRPIDPDTGEAYMVKVGRRAAGRLLDGREWNEFP